MSNTDTKFYFSIERLPNTVTILQFQIGKVFLKVAIQLNVTLDIFHIINSCHSSWQIILN